MKSLQHRRIGGEARVRKSFGKQLKSWRLPPGNFRLSSIYTSMNLGGERYLRTTRPCPIVSSRNFVIPCHPLGAIGHPDVKPGILEKGILLRLRFELEQYIQSPAGETLRRTVLSVEGQESRGYRLCPLFAENNEGLYTGSVASSSRARRTRLRCRKASTPAAVSSAVCDSPSSLRGNETGRKS